MTLTQSLFAGMMLSGYPVGRDIHRTNAYALFVLSLVGVVVAIATQRQTRAGRRLISALAHFMVGIIVVAALGILSREGYRLHWLHLPAGVVMMGMASTIRNAASGIQSPSME
jgi:heme A synthase